jgi:hypothetical protein
VRVTGHDRRNGKWQELTTAEDVSRTGVQLNLRQRVRRGMVLHVSLPLPWKLRQHSHFEPTFQTYAWVARVRPSDQTGMKRVGLEFLGANPPAGYLDKPWAIYRPPGWNGSERRREPRQARAENVWVTYLSDAQQPLSQEGGRTENLSRTGTRICVKTPPADCDLIKVAATDCNFESLAVITDRYPGKDGFHRLCVQFIGQEWQPEEARAEGIKQSNPSDQTVSETARESAHVIMVEEALLEIGATLKACQGSLDEQAIKRLQHAIACIRGEHGSVLDVSDLLNAIEYAANSLYSKKDLGALGGERLRMQILSDSLRLKNFLTTRGLLASASQGKS